MNDYHNNYNRKVTLLFILSSNTFENIEVKLFSRKVILFHCETLARHVCSCLLQLPFWLKAWPQIAQLKGFSPVCIRICIFSWDGPGKHFMQNLQTCSPILYLLCICCCWWGGACSGWIDIAWISLNNCISGPALVSDLARATGDDSLMIPGENRKK